MVVESREIKGLQAASWVWIPEVSGGRGRRGRGLGLGPGRDIRHVGQVKLTYPSEARVVQRLFLNTCCLSSYQEQREWIDRHLGDLNGRASTCPGGRRNQGRGDPEPSNFAEKPFSPALLLVGNARMTPPPVEPCLGWCFWVWQSKHPLSLWLLQGLRGKG